MKEIRFQKKHMLIGLFVLIASGQALSQNGTNGVNGGYVGSDRWFAQMRQSAANQAMLRSIAGARSVQQLPADYVEFAGQIVFPHGKNPFPRGRFPDLRIRCRNQSADNVERAPFVDDEGGFYTVFMKGQSYDFYWMYFAGGKEKFAVININSDGPRQRKVAIPYSPGVMSQLTTSRSSSPDTRETRGRVTKKSRNKREIAIRKEFRSIRRT